MLLRKNKVKKANNKVKIEQPNYLGNLESYWESIQVSDQEYFACELAVYFILNSRYNCIMLCSLLPKYYSRFYTLSLKITMWV